MTRVYQKSHHITSNDADKYNVADYTTADYTNVLEDALQPLTRHEEQRQRQRSARRYQRLEHQRHEDAVYAAMEANPFKWMP
jgi:hypothetical protein